MKRMDFLKSVAWVAVMPAVLFAACSGNSEQQAAGAHQQTYTCPMHPQIVQDKPGTCPICAMDLVPFDKNNKDATLTLGESQITLANITTTVVGTGALSNFRQLNGRLVTNPENTAVISSRVPGRLEVLYVKETGVKVIKGQPLYRIYSEQLAALQQEYLLAVAQVKQFPDDQKFRQIEQAAKQKLLLYDQQEAQLRQLTAAGKVDPYVTYTATASGIISQITATEGQYVSEGGEVMRLEGYQQLWAEADVYPAEAALVRVGQQVKVLVAGYENEPQQMTIQFINPALQTGSQLMQIRGTVPNPANQWQPGQQVNMLLPLASKGNVISLPVDAVIRDGKGAHVWLETAPGKFAPRRIRTGMEDFDAVEITEGLKEGDKVVITGAYLLYSEYILKKGADPMAAL
ncbi:membrane fusion protein, Cu(I)/Ag(I) efflux system [Chitinophaga jiangningensis]|uniref:Membrane fusion protein, Cu(I)/Ag(I) efflux system n=1 Tax=Chitinophaga jiangningensis TaxID=1419482 RepID=A0A1M7KJG8_9BACT|nr:efflux RND transporter periplasmic adaptor subunit [Chitinophaga jiangningensis]SHM65548.1 membrane fusion protein, Cu(I)/Ag(I) efflux system [Chitinophaga jiangningensis]